MSRPRLGMLTGILIEHCILPGAADSASKRHEGTIFLAGRIYPPIKEKIICGSVFIPVLELLILRDSLRWFLLCYLVIIASHVLCRT